MEATTAAVEADDALVMVLTALKACDDDAGLTSARLESSAEAGRAVSVAAGADDEIKVELTLAGMTVAAV